MPSGDGYFFNRRTKRYVKIQEHATDALERPDVFGTHHIQHLNPVINRDEVVLTVLKNGFIRVRDWKGFLGWQFWGDVESSLKALKNYIKSRELGIGYVITFTDFETGKEVHANPDYFLYRKSEEIFR